MGYRGEDILIDPGMLFRKMYCAKCGERLKIQKQSRIVKKGEKDFDPYTGHGIAIGMTELKLTEFVYICPKCQRITTYKQQLTISKKQKRLRKRIGDVKEILILRLKRNVDGSSVYVSYYCLVLAKDALIGLSDDYKLYAKNKNLMLLDYTKENTEILKQFTNMEIKDMRK